MSRPHPPASAAGRPTAAPGKGSGGGWTGGQRQALVALLPRLRAYARTLQPGTHAADDLLHDAVARALAATPPDAGQAASATDPALARWLFTIVRNHAFNLARRRRLERRVSAMMEQYEPPPVPPPDSDAQARELAAELLRLPLVQREAVLLVGAHSFSYEEAAAITGAPVGTVKARVARGRASIARRLAAALIRRPASSA